GITTLAKDSIFMMPQLGVLAQVHPDAAMAVFLRDCLIHLGSCVAPRGVGKPGKPCFEFEISGDGIHEKGELHVGELRLIPLADGRKARITVRPARGFDMGEGPKKEVAGEVRGGTVGVILDARGRPLEFPQDEAARLAAVRNWTAALDLYP
ncbi:MAG: methylaspartate mutase, partial [Planctomycetaceae bacterium]